MKGATEASNDTKNTFIVDSSAFSCRVYLSRRQERRKGAKLAPGIVRAACRFDTGEITRTECGNTL